VSGVNGGLCHRQLREWGVVLVRWNEVNGRRGGGDWDVGLAGRTSLVAVFDRLVPLPADGCGFYLDFFRNTVQT
jgi:hypothetical protein